MTGYCQNESAFNKDSTAPDVELSFFKAISLHLNVYRFQVHGSMLVLYQFDIITLLYGIHEMDHSLPNHISVCFVVFTFLYNGSEYRNIFSEFRAAQLEIFMFRTVNVIHGSLSDHSLGSF